MKRVAIVTACVVVGWFVLLAILDVTLANVQARHTTDRLGESLQATATIGSSDLALVRGRLELERLAVRRDDAVGHLAIDVDDVSCELAPLGLALVDSECRELAVRGTRLEVSTAALFQIKAPRHAPVRARRVVIDGAELVFSPSAFVPSLGRIAISIEHAEAGATVFRTPLSWLFSLEQLRARLELPAGIALSLAYDGGVLSVAGSLFGTTPVALPIVLPLADVAHDAREEVKLLVDTGKDIAEKLVAKRAMDWLRSRLH